MRCALGPRQQFVTLHRSRGTQLLDLPRECLALIFRHCFDGSRFTYNGIVGALPTEDGLPRLASLLLLCRTTYKLVRPLVWQVRAGCSLFRNERQLMDQRRLSSSRPAQRRRNDCCTFSLANPNRLQRAYEASASALRIDRPGKGNGVSQRRPRPSSFAWIKSNTSVCRLASWRAASITAIRTPSTTCSSRCFAVYSRQARRIAI